MIDALLVFEPSGVVRGLWTDLIPLGELGTLDVRRASSIEFNPATAKWDTRWAGSDEVVFSDPSRDECIRWEHEQFNAALCA